MRKSINRVNARIKEMHCNLCGKEIEVRNGIVREGVMSVDIEWGYFSNKDGQIDSFDLCEECYNKLLSQFVIPVDEKMQKELI